MENFRYEKSHEKMKTIMTLVVLALFFVWMYLSQDHIRQIQSARHVNMVTQMEFSMALMEKVVPKEGVLLPAIWGNLGAQLVANGAIDAEKMRNLYTKRGGFPEEYEELLSGQNNGQIKITEQNADYLLNLFWALGLANKNPILESGEMMAGGKDEAAHFASTGGWTIAKGSPMDHYSQHQLIILTKEQQELVERVSKNIYRPCCDNATHFPDCNHGMAMLGFLELLASQGTNEEDMYKAALALNSFWFKDAYTTIAAYEKQKGVEWENVSPEEMLGFNYSSGSGYAKVAAHVTFAAPKNSGGGCGL